MTSTGSSDPLRKPTAREYYPWWLDNLADDVTGEGAAMQGVLEGAENVRRLVLDARALYEHQEFEFTGDYGANGFIEEYTCQIQGEPTSVVVTVKRNTDGKAQHLVVNHWPRSSVGAAWPMIHHEVLGLSVGVALNRDDNAGGLALDLAGVLLDEPVGAVIPGELELLVLIQRAGVEHESSHILGALQDALHRRALPSDVVGQVVQPPRIILARGRLANGIAASSRCHIVPPSKSGDVPAAMREARA